MWFVIAILLGGAPVDVEQVRTVDGPFMSIQSCQKVAQEVAKAVNEGRVEAYPVVKGKKYRFGCLPIKPDRRIVI